MNHPTSLSNLQAALHSHPLYDAIDSQARLATFMASHVFAVWDFMTLLKSLQMKLTSVTFPWLPPQDPEAARLVNAIVLGEESDLLPDGTITSHFELYLGAMRDVGAETEGIDAFVNALARGATVAQSLVNAGVTDDVRAFVQTTVAVATHGTVEEVAAFFLYGREDPIPHMFTRLLDRLPRSASTETLRTYLARHIEVDGDEHGPAAGALLTRLIGDDPERAHRAEVASRRAIAARIALWDGVLVRLDADFPSDPLTAMI